jgi:hypothetical protein
MASGTAAAAADPSQIACVPVAALLRAPTANSNSTIHPRLDQSSHCKQLVIRFSYACSASRLRFSSDAKQSQKKIDEAVDGDETARHRKDG